MKIKQINFGACALIVLLLIFTGCKEPENSKPKSPKKEEKKCITSTDNVECTPYQEQAVVNLIKKASDPDYRLSDEDRKNLEEADNNLSHVESKKNNPQKAIEFYDKVLLSKPNNKKALEGKKRALEYIETQKRIVNLPKVFPFAQPSYIQELKTELLVKNEQYDEALREIKKALRKEGGEKDPSPQYYYWRVFVMEKLQLIYCSLFDIKGNLRPDAEREQIDEIRKSARQLCKWTNDVMLNDITRLQQFIKDRRIFRGTNPESKHDYPDVVIKETLDEWLIKQRRLRQYLLQNKE